MTRSQHSLFLAALPAVVAVTSVQARVQEYQVVRLISYRTNCNLDRLENVSPATGPLRFHATCANLTFYPDGLEVVCDDRDDDRTCKVATAGRTFRNLELLKPKN